MQRRHIIQCFSAALLAVNVGIPAARASSLPSLAFDEMYGAASVLGLTFSEKMKGLAGQRITVDGFMAPPLKADANFLVLTEMPVSLCPFCNSDADWIESIMVVYLSKKQRFVQNNQRIRVTGRLELGSYTDPETGFVSLVRLTDAVFELMD